MAVHFLQSKVNNGAYDGDRLRAENWNWPQGTWFRTRLGNLRRGSDKYSKESIEQELQWLCRQQ